MSLTQYDVGGGNRANVSTSTPLPVSPVASAANGLSKARIVAAASTNATSVKGSAGNLYAINVSNVAAYDVFLKVYDKATAPTVGTDTPVATFRIKTGTDRDIVITDIGAAFANGIAYAITKLIADSDTTVVVANDLTGWLLYA